MQTKYWAPIGGIILGIMAAVLWPILLYAMGLELAERRHAEVLRARRACAEELHHARSALLRAQIGLPTTIHQRETLVGDDPIGVVTTTSTTTTVPTDEVGVATIPVATGCLWYDPVVADGADPRTLPVTDLIALNFLVRSPWLDVVVGHETDGKLHVTVRDASQVVVSVTPDAATWQDVLDVP